MQALVYNGPGCKSLEDRPKPAIQGLGDAIVKITRTTICGTDLHILKGDVPACKPGTILGHGIPSQDPNPAAQIAQDPKEAEREARSVVVGGGVVGGAAIGATVGVVVAGPVGVVVGGALGAVAGALGGTAAGTMMNPAHSVTLEPGATMIKNSCITGKVEYREGDGANIAIRPGPCQVDETALDVTLSWVDGDSHGSAAMPLSDYRSYVASHAIRIDD